MKRGVIILLMVLPLVQSMAQQPEADRIMIRCRELSLTGSMSAMINLSIVEKGGASRFRTISMTSKSYPGGTEKRFIKIVRMRCGSFCRLSEKRAVLSVRKREKAS
jgi:hypothetical protein